jgi:hypothetical protein
MKRYIRVGLGLIIITSLLTGIVIGEDPSNNGFQLPDNGTGNFNSSHQLTVITGDSTSLKNQDTPKKVADLLVVNQDGNVVYRNSTYDKYWDVDPVPNTSYTVLYAASLHLSSCETDAHCYRNVVVEHNLSTDKTTVLYSRVQTGYAGLRAHDVDRYDNGDLLVADIASDRVYRVDPDTGMTKWSWDAQADFEISTGGSFPDDWTHLNDVEIVHNDWVMVSLRNQDQVAFLSPTGGLVENWTLGSENEYSTLYEQHNPDYIPQENGGPAVVVADSENHRVIEYQRSNNSWKQSWVWSDSRMVWPRDADRLPNGNTLITDSNGNRVFEISPEGDIVWSYDVAFPYEAERLGTGDESTGGSSAERINLQSRGGSAINSNKPDESSTSSTGLVAVIKGILPGPIVSGLIYIMPAWLSPVELLLFSIAGGSTVLLCIFEYRWSNLKLNARAPVTIKRR